MSTTRWLTSLALGLALAITPPAYAELHLKGSETCHEVSASEFAAAGAGTIGTLLLFVYTPTQDVEMKVGAGYVFAQAALDLYKTGKYALAKCSQPPPQLKTAAPAQSAPGKPNQDVVVMAPKTDLSPTTATTESSAVGKLLAKRTFLDDVNNLQTRRFLDELNNLQTLAPAKAALAAKSDEPAPPNPSAPPSPNAFRTPEPSQNWSLPPPGGAPFGAGTLERPILTAALTGTVSDAQTRAALDGAAVKLVGPTPSDWRGVYARGGQFEFTDLPAGTYFVEATQDGYSPNGRWVNVIANGRASVSVALEHGQDCAFNVANDTPWQVEVSVAGYTYSPMEVGPFAGVVFPGNPDGPTEIVAQANFVDHPQLIWGPFTFGCNGLQTVPLEPPPPEPAMSPAPGAYGPPPPSYPPPADYEPPSGDSPFPG